VSYADPQTVTFPTAGATTLPRTGSGLNTGAFTSASGNTKLEIAHQTTTRNRVRSTARLTFKKISADPLVTGQNLEHRVTAYLVVDRPVTGLTAAELKDITDGFAAWMTASTAANMVKLHGLEN
jgi:hypothetical protein